MKKNIAFRIAPYLDSQLIVFLEEKTRDEALRKLVEKAAAAGKIEDTVSFYQAIIEREKIVSTGVGMGVAIPHAKLAAYDNFFIVIGILKQGVDWRAIDHAPVRFVFLIGGPDDKQTEYLQLLSNLTLAIKDETMRKKMLAAHTADGVMALFRTL